MIWLKVLLALSSGQVGAAVIAPEKLQFVNYDFGSCSAETAPSWDFSGNPMALRKTQGEGAYLYSQATCGEWNPEFANNGFRCCGNFVPGRAARRRKLNRCAPHRRGGSFCQEMTTDQRKYTQDVQSGKIPDVLHRIFDQYGANGEQAMCSVNNGFLMHGRRLVPTAHNRIAIRNPARCVDFGTDGMIGALEWTGREVAKRFSAPEYAGVKVVVGDIAAPRGGCLSGRGGRRGHASHTNGLDADVGFLVAKANRASPVELHRDFDATLNWWFVKQLLANPFACVKVIFLDKKLIAKLGKVARGDPEWPTLSRFLRHMPFHRNHYHVRVGLLPGGPNSWGCGGVPELEEEEEMVPEPGELDPDEISAADLLAADEDDEDVSSDEDEADVSVKAENALKPKPSPIPAPLDESEAEIDNLSRKIKLPPVPAWVPYTENPR